MNKGKSCSLEAKHRFKVINPTNKGLKQWLLIKIKQILELM